MDRRLIGLVLSWGVLAWFAARGGLGHRGLRGELSALSEQV